MKKRISKRMLYIILSVVIIAVCSLTIAYSVLSSTLIITGSTEITGSSWNLVVSQMNLDDVIPNGCATTNQGCGEYHTFIGDARLLKQPTITGTIISDFEMSVTKPGDNICLLFSVENKGTIPAKLSSKNISTPVFLSDTNNLSDIEWAEENVFISSDIFKSNVTEFFIDDTLCPGDIALFQICLHVEYNSERVSSSKLTVTNLSSEYIFTQTDMSTCN